MILSCVIQGLVLVPVHGCLVQSELEHIIQKTNPSVLFVSTNYFSKVAAAVKNVNGNNKSIAVEITNASLAKPGDIVSSQNSVHKVEDFEFKQIFSLDQVREKGRKRFESGEEITVISLEKQDVSAVLFTSGSTGIPKGAVSFILFLNINFIYLYTIFLISQKIFTEDLMMPSEGVANVQPFVRVDFQSYDPSFSLSILQTMLCGGSRLFCLYVYLFFFS